MESGGKGVEDLTVDLMHLIIDKVVEDSGIEGASKLRQVSKAWLSAFSQYPGRGMAKSAHRVGVVCKILPQMQSLSTLGTSQSSIHFHALTALTQLTSITIQGSALHGGNFILPTCDLSYLPPSLCSLSLWDLRLQEHGPVDLQRPHITRLALHQVSGSAKHLSKLLHSLTSLKDLVIDIVKLGPRVERLYCRLPGLTSLTLQCLYMRSWDTTWPSSLQRLVIRDLCTEFGTSGDPFNGLTHLTYLGLLHNEFLSAPMPIKFPPTLLKLDCDFLRVEDAQLCRPDLSRLQEFCWSGGEGEYLDLTTVRFMARLTGLTSLRLRSVAVWDDVMPIAEMPCLQELFLLDCHGVSRGLSLQLFSSGGFRSLRSLCIFEGRWLKPRPFKYKLWEIVSEGEDPSQVWQYVNHENAKKEAEAIGPLVLSLPNLTKVSGSCVLIDHGMQKGLQSWHKSNGDCSQFYGRAWTKP